MTAVAPHSVVPRPFPPIKRSRGSRFLGYLSTTDPKRLGVMYIVTSVRVLHGRCVGVADAGRAGPARPAVPVSGAAQPALAGQYRDAPPVPGLPADRRVHHAEHDLHDRVVRVGCIGLSFVWNVLRSSNYGERTSAGDPWGCSNSLEWATSSPPPRHNFLSLPRVRSERPAFDCTTRRCSTRSRAESHPRRGWEPLHAAGSGPHMAIGIRSTHPDDNRAPNSHADARGTVFLAGPAASPPAAPGRARSGGPQRPRGPSKDEARPTGKGKKVRTS